MTTDSNKALVRAYHTELWEKGDKTSIDRYWSADAKVDVTDFDSNAIDAIHDDVARYWGAFKDVETEILTLVAEGDQVVLHWQTSGLHFGPYGDVAATNKRITMAGIDILRIENERIVECSSMWDGLSVYDQLGVLNIG
ncbi:ester cyclase [Pacificibacter sp. AS14]|uniref:ester cyclase n=1 Tax=Pacificibacter sp. AS14 TaxID=3135785 RepID=UPI00317B43EF